MIVLVPIFIVAAFFESYLTHLMSNTFDKENNAGMPVWVSAVILGASLSFISWYFVLYPIRLHKKMNNASLNNKLSFSWIATAKSSKP